MNNLVFVLLLGLSLIGHSSSTTTSFSEGDISYDYSASIECKSTPDDPLYNGGIIKNRGLKIHRRPHRFRIPDSAPTFVLNYLTGNTVYTFSSWVKITGAATAVIKATVTTDNTTFKCMGTVIAKSGCWSFLKGGFVLDSPSTYALIYFQERKRVATLHVSDIDGKMIRGATVVIKQVSRGFPFGSAIADTILGNLAYQNWFTERFNAAVFENELKWNSIEPQRRQVNYTIPDKMLEFTRSNQITVRGHNIFWEDPKYTPSWVRNLTTPDLKSAINSRIQSLTSKYKNEFIHWDVDNEMLHWDFYEQRLGPNASIEFFQTAQKLDPLARLFMNEFNVVETCDDMNSTVDHYVSRLQKLGEGGIFMDGIGLEGHFTVPNPPLIRAVLDKLALLKLPIWLTEVDISNSLDQETQAKYLEIVLREVFSHPSANGIMLWTALHPSGCYQMCLTDNNFRNLPTGDIVDSLLKEWQTGVVKGETDEHGSFNFSGFFGEYNISVNYNNRTTYSTLSLCPGDETKHWNIHVSKF